MGRRFFAALLMGLALTPAAEAACPDDTAIARFAGQILQRQSPTPFAALSPAEGRCVQNKLIAIFAQPQNFPLVAFSETKCITKSTENYYKYLIETYNRQLSQKIRLNIEE